MPEGPEVKYLSEIAKKYTIGRTIIGIVSNTKTKIHIPKKSKILDVGVKGKMMWLETVDYYMYIHFGLTGWLLFEDSKYPKYIIEMNDLNMYIDDSRRFSKIHILKDKTKHTKLMEEFGIDILTKEFTYEVFSSTIKSKSQIIVYALMDQEIFAGIGNYIKNESLYISHISPHRKTNELSESEIRKLYFSIKFVAFSNLIEMLRMARIKIPTNIDKLKPSKLQIPYKFKVYANDVDPHGNTITIENVGGRTTYYVKSLQL